ncbi:MAG: hypothetical protein ABI707_10960 [Ferruginibacter sp.]
MPCERRPENTNCKFQPNKKEPCQESATDGNPVPGFAYLPHYKLTHETGTEE